MAVINESIWNDISDEGIDPVKLGLSQEEIDAIEKASVNIEKLFTSIEDSRVSTVVANTLWDQSEDAYDRLMEPKNPLMMTASCVGGIEFSLIHYHPVHGSKDISLSEDEYRLLSAPYVATFEAELYPGDLKNDLVLSGYRYDLDRKLRCGKNEAG